MEESASSVCEVIRASSMHKAKQACVLRMVSMLARLLSQSVALGLSTWHDTCHPTAALMCAFVLCKSKSMNIRVFYSFFRQCYVNCEQYSSFC